MRIAYVNAFYQQNHTGGGHVHMGQFVKNATAFGHEVWAYPGYQYPDSHIIPVNRIDHIKTMRSMNVLYIRLESIFPQICTWSLPPRRLLYGFPLVVWEFNTIPDDASFYGESNKAITKVINNLKYYGQGCDLAICVADAAAEYVQKKLCIRNTLVVPNGSDPELFNPSVEPVERMKQYKGSINVVWIGSAQIKYHDFEMLKNTARILWESNKRDRIVFHIIGPNLVGAMGDMPPNVYYWGAENYQKLPTWLAAMDIGLYITHGGSSVYGSPLKVFDYLASGLAVVSTEHPFVRNLFEEMSQEDLMVPPHDSNQLANVLLKLGSDRDRIHRLGQAGRQLVIERYNWRRTVQETLNSLDALLMKRKTK